jgi:AcrR family transcriptional regulator
VVLRDARQQLFAAAERVLLRDGVGGLTSRAVTAEAGVAKGVLHRHFEDFDAFLAELVTDRVQRLETWSTALLQSAGERSVADNLTEALTELFGPVEIAVAGLVISRDALRARLRAAGLAGMPILTQAASAITDYLRAEQDRGRLAAGADVTGLAPALVGAGSLLFSGQESGPPDEAQAHRMVTATIAGSLVSRPARSRRR